MADPSAVAILKKGKEVWNKTTTSRDLSGVDFAELMGIAEEMRKGSVGIPSDIFLKYTGIDFNGTNLRGADLSYVHIGANFDYADLTGANLSSANIYSSTFKEAILDGADFSDSRMVHRAYFQYCSAKGADFSRADLSHSTFNHADLTGANLTGATLREAYCIETKLNLANLTSANCEATYFMEAQLAGANLTRTNFSLATLTNAALEGAHLEETNLEQAILVQTNFGGAYIARCRIYGTAAWGIKLENAIQNELIITPQGEAEIQVDDIEVGQFIYLLLSNQKIRKVIDTVTSRAVLILGRFSLERKEVLDALRGELRERGFVPIIFDFEKPLKRDLTETVSALAHLVRFVIADITDAKSIPQELQRIVPLLPSLPIQPLIMDSQYEYAMFKDFGGYLAMLPPFRYRNKQHLLNSLEGQVIKPAIDHLEEIERRRKAFEKTLAAHE